MAVVVGRMVAILEAQTAAFEARMTAAGRQIDRFTSVTGSARRGTMLLQTGMQQLAFSGLGSLPGPLARVAGGLGVLTLGSPVMLGVMAAVGAGVLIFQRMGKAAEETEKRIDALSRQLRQLQAPQIGGLENAIRQVNFPEKGPTSAALERERQLLIREVAAKTEALDTDMKANVRRLVTIGTELNLRREITAELQKQIDNIKTMELAEQRIGMASMNRLRLSMALTPGGAGQNIVQGQAFMNMMERRLRPSFSGTQFKTFDPEFLAAGTTGLRAMFRQSLQPVEPPKPKPGFKLTPEFAIMSSMALLQGAQQGPAGFFGAAAGPVGMINPLAGAITAGVGGIFSLFDKSEEKRHQELKRELERIGKEVGLERVTLVFTGPDGHQIRTTLQDLEDSDAVERVPGPAGAQG